MLNFVKNLFINNTTQSDDSNSFKIQSFTYYIPSPPARDSGYREKQFDKIFYDLINIGYEIIDFKITPSSGQNSSGMWLVFILKALNQKANDFNLNEAIGKRASATDDTQVEGLYYMDDRSESK